MALLEVRHLTTAFAGDRLWTTVVDEVNFSVATGETLAIVGESGSGKSVTALSIMGLLSPRSARVSGSVKLAGRELLRLSDREMEEVRGNEIAMIFQEPMTSLNPVMTIGRQISETIIRHRRLPKSEAARETLSLLERVRIPGARARMGDYAHQLSGGTLQRAMIAMALAGRPKLLIADEPTTALDVTVQAQILELLRTLQEEGMAVLFITHDMGVVAEIAGRTAVMRRAKLVEMDDTRSLFARPRHAYTRALLAAVPQLGAMTGTTEPAPFLLVDPHSGIVEVKGAVPARADRTSQPVISVRHLVTRFDIRSGVLNRVKARVHAVEDVSFDIHSGETLALVGESGCGKSTIGRSILRLVKPQGGSIHVDGEDILALSGERLTRHRRRVQTIFQDPMSSLNPRMRIGETLTEPLLAHGMASRKDAQRLAADLLGRVGLQADMLNRFPHQFSGGQKQRICIARALALNPALIVADEAVSALDVSIKAQVINLMLELQAKMNLAFLFISHDMAIVERVSHRVAVMYLGEIVEIGPRAAVFGNPRHAYTRRLLSAVPVADPTRRGRRTVDLEELKSPLRDPDYVPPKRGYVEVDPGHLVLA